MDLTRGLTAVQGAIDRHDDALAGKLLGIMLKEYPESAAVTWQAGRFFGLRGDYNSAGEHFRRAVGLDRAYSHVEFAVKGHTIRLNDVPGSTSASQVVAEIGENPYRIFDTRFEPGDVIIDVGAHIGTISIILSKLHPETRILAFEPASRTFDCLVSNLGANGATNVTPIRRAVGGTRETLEMYWASEETASSSMYESCAHPSVIAESVECDTLDDVFHRYEIDRCRWLKLDCEGAEYGIFHSTGVLDRIDEVAMELHFPAGLGEMTSSKLIVAPGVAERPFANVVAARKAQGVKIPTILITSKVATIYDLPLPPTAMTNE